MSANGRTHWIKLYVEMLDDPKIGLLPDSIKWRFTSALLMAGELNEDGYLPDIDEMAWRLRVPPETLQSEMRMLAGRGLVELRLHDDGSERWFITKFKTRQDPSKNALRQRSWRERHSSGNDSVTNNVTGNDSHNNTSNVIDYTKDRNSNAPETETETETETESKRESGATAPAHPPATSPHFQPVSEASKKREKINNLLSPSPLPAIVQEAPRAMTLMQAVTGHWPGDNNREFLVESLGNEPDENALRAAFKLWNSSGYKPTNYRGICQWYQEILRDPAWTPEAQYKGRTNGNGHKKSAPIAPMKQIAPGLF
jgi:hypothetical protein